MPLPARVVCIELLVFVLRNSMDGHKQRERPVPLAVTRFRRSHDDRQAPLTQKQSQLDAGSMWLGRLMLRYAYVRRLLQFCGLNFSSGTSANVAEDGLC
ncbi:MULTISPECIES: hypothetical protein [Variovorax]|jgi:hypothetical protein|uniref:hypothetical protein n=1 Tax=Variovorax TaxID=34072 RepID=UPI00116003DB|nr:hypothetical protein [Variovorax sp. OV084]